MDTSTMLAWLEAVSTVGVLITLVYLARQVHQENLLLRSEARQSQTAMDQQHLIQFIDHPDLAKSFAGKEPISKEERTRMYFWIAASIRAREFEWTQYQSGALDKQAWEAYINVIYFTLGTQRARDYWAETQHFFNPEFVKVVNGMIEGTPVTDFWDKVEKIA
jgi:hypothetical protein